MFLKKKMAEMNINYRKRSIEIKIVVTLHTSVRTYNSMSNFAKFWFKIIPSQVITCLMTLTMTTPLVSLNIQGKNVEMNLIAAMNLKNMLIYWAMKYRKYKFYIAYFTSDTNISEI